MESYFEEAVDGLIVNGPKGSKQTGQSILDSAILHDDLSECVIGD
jgi:hypothetical protein